MSLRDRKSDFLLNAENVKSQSTTKVRFTLPAIANIVEPDSVKSDYEIEEFVLQFLRKLITLKKKLSTIISYYYSIQEDYRNKCKARIKRQAEIAGADVTKLDFDEIIGSKTDVFLRCVLPDYDVTHQYLNEITKRHESFLHMERTIDEVRDLFYDLALIIQIDKKYMMFGCITVTVMCLLVVIVMLAAF